MPNYAYTLTKTGIKKDTKFELYLQQSSLNEVQNIKNELLAAKGQQDKQKLEEDKALDENSKEDEKKEETEAAVDPYGYNNPPPVVKKEVFDATEKALFQYMENKIKDQAEQKRKELEEKKKRDDDRKKKEEETKGKDGHTPADDAESVKDEKQRDEDQERLGTEAMNFCKFDTESTFGENRKNCRRILTLWEISSRGYRKINETYIFEQLNNTIEFSPSGEYLCLALNDSKSFLIYDAQSLARLKKLELTAKDLTGYDVNYFYGINFSKDGSYLIGGDGYQRYIFDKDGKFLKCISGRNMYTIYQYSNTEFIGCRPTPDYTKTDLVAVDFINDTERVIENLDAYISSFTANKDWTKIFYEVWPKVNMLELKGDKKKTEIIKEYSSMYRYAFKGSKIAICYSPNYSITNIALYDNDQLLWKHTLKKSYLDVTAFEFMSQDKDTDSIMLIENQYTSFQIYLFDENVATDYTLKSIRNVVFQYPYLAYVVGTKELWLQDMHNKVSIFYFDSSIAGVENSAKIKAESSDGFKLGITLDYQNYYQIAEVTLGCPNPFINMYLRRIMKEDLPDAKVKAFYKIRMHNQEKKKIEESILLHLKDSFVALSLESRNIKYDFKKKINKSNVLTLADESALFFWEDNGTCIEKMKLPLDPSNPKTFSKVYEASEDIRAVKTTKMHGKEYLYVIDEGKHIKVLKNEETRLSVHKDYFVDPYFCTYQDVKTAKQSSFVNGMVYNTSGAYIVQEKGKEKEYKFSSLYYNSLSFDYNNAKFPMCSDDFILYALYPEYDPNDYTQEYQYLFLAPPMNSHRIKQRTFDKEFSIELFCHFDDKYVLFFKGEPDQRLQVAQLNGEVVQDIVVKNDGSTRYKPIFSQTGEYFVLPTMIKQADQKVKCVSPAPDPETGEHVRIDVPGFIVYKISKAKNYKRGVSLDNLNQAGNNNDDDDESKEVISIEAVEQYHFPHEKLDYGMYAYNEIFFGQLSNRDNEKHLLHIDNKGNVIFVNPEQKVFMMNGVNIWDQFEAFLQKGKLEGWDSIGVIKFGQDYIIIKKQEIIYHIVYDAEKGKLVSGKQVKHKALDIANECDLGYIIPTKLSKYVLIVYSLGDATTIVVWDLEKDIEHSNFSSRKEDIFFDYITGKNSKIGIACFNSYIVDLDNGIPNPFIYKNARAHEIDWCQGMRINIAEDIMLSLGTIVTPLCHKDIYYYKNKSSIDNLDMEKLVYYMDKKSVAFNYIDDHEDLSSVLKMFEAQPLYYSMLVLEDNDNKTPLDYAIENNAARTIEVILNNLILLPDFSLSRMIYKKFNILFNMNLKAFEKYLNTCYFVTEQMDAINKVRLKEGTDTIRESFSCCILDKEFYKEYEIMEDEEDDSKPKAIKSNAVAPLEKSASHIEDQIDNIGDDDEIPVFEEQEENPLKRVQIKGIEFDWIFNTQEGNDFLQYLSETDNIEIFGQDIIKDIILFQWFFFKRMIILKLLVPYVIYFVLFCVYATYIVYERNLESDDAGEFHIAGYILGGIILVFNAFWGYVEITQMIFHKCEYVKSFWNMLDFTSIWLNVAVVIMVFADAKYENINRVSSISVLILYFKLFYFLRIFFATAYLVRMIIEIVLDMKFFISVLMIATMAFANSFYIFGRNSSGENFAGSDIAAAFIYAYGMGLGDYETSDLATVDEEVLNIIFLLNTLIILIILLNLVIAIMGDTFDRVQETQEKSMLRELAQMIRENEFLLSRKRTFKKAKYIIVIEPEKAEGEGKGSWEGKLNQLKTFIEESSDAHIVHLKKLQDGIENIAAAALDEKMRPVEDKINHKLSQCDQRLEKIKDSVTKLFKLVEDQKKKAK